MEHIKENIITVIIPVFNAEKYIDKCIRSIINQSFSDWSLIIVDDGSTDNTLNICNAYKESDNRIEVFHKQNEGVSIARQYGLNKVISEYFIFVDADDYTERDYLKELFLSMKKHDSDIVVCSYYEEYDKNSKIINIPNTDIDGLINNFLNDKVWGITWNKLYKTQIVREYNISFVPGLQMWEDLTFTIDYCLYARNISYVNKPLYHYVKTNNSSITSFENIEKKIDRVHSIRHFESTMKLTGKYNLFHESMVKVKYHICKTFLNRNFTKERVHYFLSSFPEVFNDFHFIKLHPFPYIIIKLNLVRLLKIECDFKYYKIAIKLRIKYYLHLLKNCQ